MEFYSFFLMVFTIGLTRRCTDFRFHGTGHLSVGWPWCTIKMFPFLAEIENERSSRNDAQLVEISLTNFYFRDWTFRAVLFACVILPNLDGKYSMLSCTAFKLFKYDFFLSSK